MFQVNNTTLITDLQQTPTKENAFHTNAYTSGDVMADDDDDSVISDSGDDDVEMTTFTGSPFTSFV